MNARSLALLLALLCACPGAFAANTMASMGDWVAGSRVFLSQYRDAQARAAKAYMSGEPVEQALPSSVFLQLNNQIPLQGSGNPNIGAITVPQARDSVRGLMALKKQAAAVQSGRHPNDPVEVHQQAIEVAAEGLLGRRPNKDEKTRLRALYGDKARQGAALVKPKTRAELTMDAEAARRLLADNRLSPQVSQQVTAKAGEYAQALGGLLFTDGNGNAVIVGRRDPNAVLTQAELSAIAGMPRVRLPAGLVDLNRKVPAPVSAISPHAPKMGEPGFEYGWATGAWKFWDDWEKSQDKVAADGHWIQAGTAATTAKVMKFFYHISGFGAVEQSSDQLRWDHNRAAKVRTQIWDGTKLAANTALAALNFVPGVAAVSKAGGLTRSAKGIASGTAIYRTAKGGSQIVELGGGVGPTVAKNTAAEVRAIIASVAGKGGRVTAKDSRQILTALKKAGANESLGITVIEDRSIMGMGMATGDAGTIVINTRLGGAHEVLHAVQQYQIRSTLLRQMGKNYNQLSQAEKVIFARRVEALETVAYNQFENGAFRATGFMGSGSLNSARYANGLEANIAAFERALANGTVPQFMRSEATLLRYSPGSAVYGQLPNWIGRSQTQIATNMGAVISMSRPLYPVVNEKVSGGITSAMDWYYGVDVPQQKPPPIRKGAKR